MHCRHLYFYLAFALTFILGVAAYFALNSLVLSETERMQMETIFKGDELIEVDGCGQPVSEKRGCEHYPTIADPFSINSHLVGGINRSVPYVYFYINADNLGTVPITIDDSPQKSFVKCANSKDRSVVLKVGNGERKLAPFKSGTLVALLSNLHRGCSANVTYFVGDDPRPHQTIYELD